MVFIPTIFLVLTVHEYGHYIFARFFNLDVTEFKLGLGKTFYKKKFRNTLFSFHYFPVAAHVYINDKQFQKISLSKKLAVIAAGPFINLVFSVLIIFLFLFLVGQPSTPTSLAGVEINSPADKAGLRTNDKILKINGKPTSRYEDILKITMDSPEEEITLKVQRDKELLDINVTPELASYINNKGVKKTHGRLGVLVRHTFYKFSIIKEINGEKIEDDSFKNIQKILKQNFDQEIVIGLDSVDKKTHYYRTFLSQDLNKKYFIDDDKDRFVLGHIGNNFYKNLGLIESLKISLRRNAEILHTILTIPAQVFPIDTENFAPKSIVHSDGLNFSAKLYKFCFIASFISIVIAIINLLPIGYLDGGRIAVLLIEKKTGQAMTTKKIASMSFIVLMSIYLTIIMLNYSKFSIYMNHLYQEGIEFLNDE